MVPIGFLRSYIILNTNFLYIKDLKQANYDAIISEGRFALKLCLNLRTFKNL